MAKQAYRLFDPSGDVLVVDAHSVNAAEVPSGYEPLSFALPWEWYTSGNLPPLTLAGLYRASTGRSLNRSPSREQTREMLVEVERALADGRLKAYRRALTAPET